MISAETLEEIAAAVERDGANAQALATLRGAYPSMKLFLCDDDEVSPLVRPYLNRERFNLYLVAAGQGCPILTHELDAAQGVVIAAVDQADE